MQSFRTSPPATYIPPNKEEMREVAKKVGLKNFSPSLVGDLCNLAAGGSINPPSSYRGKITQVTKENLESPDSTGEWRLSNGRYTKDKSKALSYKVEGVMRYHQNVCDFLQTIDISKFPGNSPLEQAMSLLKLLSQQEKGKGEGEGGEGQPLPIFTDNEHPEGVAQELHETMELVDSLDEVEQEMLDLQEESNDGSPKGAENLQRLKVAEEMVDGSAKRAMLEISRHLDQFTKLQTRRQKLVKADPSGDEVRNRPIKNLGELNKVSPSTWGTHQQQPTYFWYKAITGQLPVRERITREEKKQAIFILVDGSGSMNGRKHYKATGVVMNRLKAVINGDAEVWVSVFDTKSTEPRHAATSEEAKKLINEFKNGNFRGGGTDIAGAVKSAHDFIEEKIKSGESLWRPEICVLTDEDSSISSLKKSEIKGYKVHGFAIERKNKPLVDFCKSTGGVAIENL